MEKKKMEIIQEWPNVDNVSEWCYFFFIPSLAFYRSFWNVITSVLNIEILWIGKSHNPVNGQKNGFVPVIIDLGWFFFCVLTLYLTSFDLNHYPMTKFRQVQIADDISKCI